MQIVTPNLVVPEWRFHSISLAGPPLFRLLGRALSDYSPARMAGRVLVTPAAVVAAAVWFWFRNRGASQNAVNDSLAMAKIVEDRHRARESGVLIGLHGGHGAAGDQASNHS
jgi:hypothetical protein